MDLLSEAMSFAAGLGSEFGIAVDQGVVGLNEFQVRQRPFEPP